jgi:tetratricopeptide (TPR) repeat protein
MSKLDKIEELQQLLKEDTTNFQARRQLAVLLMDCGFNEEALRHLLYLSKTFTKDSGIYYNLGIVYEKMKKFDKAKEAYLKAIELEPKSLDAIYNLGLVYVELKEYMLAIESFKYILSIEKNDSNSYFNLGLVYFKKGKYLQAIENFQKTVDINDEDLYAHFYIGNIFKELGDLDSAKSEFEKVIELSPNYSWAYFNLAVIYNEEGNLDLAVENLQKTIEMNLYDVEAYEILIRILLKQHDYSRADEILNSAFQNCDETGDLDYIAAMVYEKLEDKENAVEYLERAIKNSQTLSISVKKVQDELKNLK